MKKFIVMTSDGYIVNDFETAPEAEGLAEAMAKNNPGSRYYWCKTYASVVCDPIVIKEYYQ